MSFRRWLFTVFACCAATLLAEGAPAERSARPHIIFILADDLCPGDLGCYGGTIVPTPRIDQLAAEGTRFTQYYSASPICSTNSKFRTFRG